MEKQVKCPVETEYCMYEVETGDGEDECNESDDHRKLGDI